MLKFLGFQKVSDLIGAGLANKLLALTTAGIPVSYMIGQATTELHPCLVAKMECKKHICRKCPTSMYVHCISHCLNVCLYKAVEVTGIKIAVTIMNEIVLSQFMPENKKSSRTNST